MALAKKCDRCGKLYEHYPSGNKIEYNSVRRVCRFQNGEINCQNTVLDLCPECISEFDKWMIGGKFDDQQT